MFINECRLLLIKQKNLQISFVSLFLNCLTYSSPFLHHPTHATNAPEATKWNTPPPPSPSPSPPRYRGRCLYHCPPSPPRSEAGLLHTGDRLCVCPRSRGGGGYHTLGGGGVSARPPAEQLPAFYVYTLALAEIPVYV
jgi:hypothetical protein